MTVRVWVGGHSENDINDPLNWSPGGISPGDGLILQSGTVGIGTLDVTLWGTAGLSPLQIAPGGDPVIDLTDPGSITVTPGTTAPTGLTINVAGDASQPFEKGDPKLSISNPGSAAFDVTINMLGTSGLYWTQSAMGPGTLTVNGSSGVVVPFGPHDFVGTQVTMNAGLSGWDNSATGGPGLLYLSGGAAFTLNGTAGYDIFYVGESSSNVLSPASLVLRSGHAAGSALLEDGVIELKGFRAYQGDTPAVSIDLSSHDVTVLAADGSTGYTLTDPANSLAVMQNGDGLFIGTPGAAMPAGSQVDIGYSDVSLTPDERLVRGTSASLYDPQGNQWAIDTGGQITVNGTVDPTTAAVELLYEHGGTIWQENSAGQWWSRTAANGAWVACSGSGLPVALPTPESPDGSVLASGSTGGLQDADGNLWTIVNGQVAVNGFIDPSTANVTHLVLSHDAIWQENTAGLWWSKTTPASAWTQGGDPLAPVAGVTPAGPPNDFQIADQSNGGTWQSQGTAYAGPVTGLSREIILATSDNVNVTAEVPNVFIHTGSGEDGLNVAGVNGDNVLDGSTGSNFLVGGTGTDQFYVDDRSAAANTWSTVVNFHSGDNATIWGITQADFTVLWLDNQGAPGATGLTGVFTPTTSGQPVASITLAKYTSADLTNGRLTVSYGRTPDMTGLPGSDYVTIHAD